MCTNDYFVYTCVDHKFVTEIRTLTESTTRVPGGSAPSGILEGSPRNEAQSQRSRAASICGSCIRYVLGATPSKTVSTRPAY